MGNGDTLAARQSFMEPEIKIAEQFGNLIARSDYSAAHALLTQKAQSVYSAEGFKKSVEDMTGYNSPHTSWECATDEDCFSRQ